MKGIVEERAIRLGEHIVENKDTVRRTAVKFGISKSTVHKDVTDRLKSINPHLYREVGIVLEQNKQERHMRGGEATKQKYLHLKQTVTQENDGKFAFSAEIADEK